MTNSGFTVRPAAWFGSNDDRHDPWLVPKLPAPILENAVRTCYLIGVSAIASRRSFVVRLHHERFGAWNSLCSDERFSEQPIVIEKGSASSGGFGYSGYLVGPDTVLTCWHGWEYFSSRAQIAVFGYAVRPEVADPLEFSSRMVQPVAQIPMSRPDPRVQAGSCNNDWVVLRLEHAVPQSVPVSPPRIQAPKVGQAVYTLGHPGGLPLKLTDRATVTRVSDDSFRTDLDTFAGNSGSPVFDAETHALVGIVAEGQPGAADFSAQVERGCYVANRVDRNVEGQLSVLAKCFASAIAG